MAENLRALEKELAQVRAEATGAVAAREEAVEEAREAKAQLVSVKAKARALLEEQEQQMRRRKPTQSQQTPATVAPITNGSGNDASDLPPFQSPWQPPALSAACARNAEACSSAAAANPAAANPPAACFTSTALHSAPAGAPAGAPAAEASAVDEVAAVRRYALAQARLEADLSQQAAQRAALEENVTRLEAELSAMRQNAVLHAEGSANLGYLKHVLLALLEPKDGRDEGPLLQVVFTFLQFSEAEVARVCAARANTADRGGGGRLSSRLSLGFFR